MNRILKICAICNDKNVVKRSKQNEWYCSSHVDYMQSELIKEEIKRVPISSSQYWIARKKAASKQMKVTEYLDDLVNKDNEINA